MGCRGLTAELGPCWVTGLRAAGPGALTLIVMPRQQQMDVGADAGGQKRPKKPKIKEDPEWQQAESHAKQLARASGSIGRHKSGGGTGGGAKQGGGSSRSGARKRPPKKDQGQRKASLNPLDLLAAAAAASRTVSGVSNRSSRTADGKFEEATEGGAVAPAAQQAMALVGAAVVAAGAVPGPTSPPMKGVAAAAAMEAAGAAAGPMMDVVEAVGPGGQPASHGDSGGGGGGPVAVSTGTMSDLAFLSQLGGCAKAVKGCMATCWQLKHTLLIA
jgi:hypothetical protein